MNVVFLGPPGSGKGTMAERVSKSCNLVHISTGEILRDEIKRETELGKSAQNYIDKGELVPDAVMIGMMRERVQQEDAKNGVLLDGFPRTVEQGEELDKFLQIDACINLVVEAEVIIERVLSRRMCAECGTIHSIKIDACNSCKECGSVRLEIRADDNEETVRNRFKIYEEQTFPLIDYYNKQGILYDVDATLPIEEEAELICSILKKVESKG